MGEVKWHFPVLSGGGEQGGTSNDIEAFKGEELYANLARETCQNSLDAKDPNSIDPVFVKYELKEFDIKAYPFFMQYLSCLDSCERYWTCRKDGIPPRLKELLEGAKKALRDGKVRALVVGDYNTTGLLGSKGKTGSFNALVYAEGVSYKDSDASAGTFGIGRNAPFACSSLRCVCYNTKATDGGEAFAGVAQLATMWNEDNRRTMKLGRYQYIDVDCDDECRAIEPSDNDLFAQEFGRDGCGTDVIILGFDDFDGWEEELEAAILQNFFLAICENKLIVEVQGKVIDSNTIGGILEARSNEKNVELTRQYYKALTDPESKHHNLTILEENDAELFIRSDAEIANLKNVAWFRSNGMLIRSYKPQGIFRPYIAVFVAKGNLDKLLRATEPARHNDWDYKRIGEAEERKQARRAVESLKKQVKDAIKREFESAVVESMDAVGAAEFLPDEVDGMTREGGGDDALRPLIKIGKIDQRKHSKPSEKVQGKKSTGSVAMGTVHNFRQYPHPDRKDDPTKAVAGTGNTSGVSAGHGGKTIERPVSGNRRLFAIAPDQGLYRLVVVPDESSERVYATYSAIGENGKREKMRVKAAMLEGRPVSIDSDKLRIGPFGIREGERLSLEVRFEDSGSMAFAVELTVEGGAK